MDNLSSFWEAALDSSPKELAVQLWRFIDGEVTDDDEPSTSPEYVADLYSSLMSEPQRSSFRDAAAMALIAHINDNPENPDTYIALATLASHIQLLTAGSTRLQDRLWMTVRQSEEFSPQLSCLLSFIAEEGSVRPVDEWTSVLSQFGPDAAMACAEGVRRHSVIDVLYWMQDTLDVQLFNGLMPAILPLLFQDDTPAIAALVRGPRSQKELSLRSRLVKWMSRYDITLPEKYRATSVEQSPRPASTTALQAKVSFSDYRQLNEQTTSPVEAAAAWIVVEEHATWPSVLTQEAHQHA